MNLQGGMLGGYNVCPLYPFPSLFVFLIASRPRAFHMGEEMN